MDERGTFAGLIYCVVGSLSKSFSQISQLISLHGGQIAHSMKNPDITHIVSTVDEIRKRNSVVNQAKERDILIVSETYLLACIEARRRLPEQKFILRETSETKPPIHSTKRIKKGTQRPSEKDLEDPTPGSFFLIYFFFFSSFQKKPEIKSKMEQILLKISSSSLFLFSPFSILFFIFLSCINKLFSLCISLKSDPPFFFLFLFPLFQFSSSFLTEKRKFLLSSFLNDLCFKGDTEGVLNLLRGDHSVTQHSEDGEAPLHCATEGGHCKLVELLISKGASVNVRTKFGTTPLHCAAWQGNTEMVNLLLSHGASLNLENTYGEIPLHCAAREGFENVVQILLDHGANINQGDWFGATSFLKAADRGHVSIVRLLFSRGANPHAQNWKGQTARDLAQSKGHDPVVELIDSFLSKEMKKEKVLGENEIVSKSPPESPKEPPKKRRKRTKSPPSEILRSVAIENSTICSCSQIRLRSHKLCSAKNHQAS